MSTETNKLPERLEQFHRLSLKLIGLAEKGRVISDYYEDVTRLLIDFSGANYIAIVAKGANSYFRFRYSQHNQWEMTQLDHFPDSSVDLKVLDSFPGLNANRDTTDKLESLVFSGNAADTAYSTKHCGLIIYPELEMDSAETLKTILVLQALGWQNQFKLEEREIELYQYLFDLIGFARSHRQAKFLLGERIKELKTIYQINRIGTEPGKSLEDIMQGAADIIPPGFLHPEHTCCKIVFANGEFISSNLKSRSIR
jgi:hypothetical protein